MSQVKNEDAEFEHTIAVLRARNRAIITDTRSAWMDLDDALAAQAGFRLLSEFLPAAAFEMPEDK